MPGFPMGGFSAGGRISRGVWTRLHATAVYLEDASGQCLVLVSCDLWAMPGGLADRVAELVAKEYGAKHIGREHILIAATHTHHSPGNFSTSSFYNVFASPGIGFDGDLFDWLAHRIALSVQRAWKRSEPAVAHLNQRRIGGISRNRSLVAFLKNGVEAGRVLLENEDIEIEPTPFPVNRHAYRAIDPTLTVLTLRSSPPRENVIAAAAFFAVHPTAMGPATEVYNSDIFGVAADHVIRNLNVRGARPAVAIFNGPAGDISSNWRRQDRPSTVDLGVKLGEHILELTKGGEAIQGPVAVSFSSIDFTKGPDPMVGAPVLGGSEGDWSFLHDAGWREGIKAPGPPSGEQWPKQDPLASEIDILDTDFAIPFALKHVVKVPKTARLGVYRIGGLVLATLPGEFSMMLGRRISRDIRRRCRHPVVLVSLANEYVSYFTTPEEYDAQHYEGASMLYGSNAGMRILTKLSELAGRLGKAKRRKSKFKYSYNPGIRHSFNVGAFDFLSHLERLKATYYTLHNVLMNAEKGIPIPDYPHLVWIDKNPEWHSNPADMKQVSPIVQVEAYKDGTWGPLLVDGIPETDSGVNFVTAVIGTLFEKTRWITYWMPPANVDESIGLRLRVEGISGTFVSRAFSLATIKEYKGYLGLVRKPTINPADE